MTIHPTIYKRTSTGAVQVWFAETDGNKYRSTSGQIDGEKTTTEWTVAEAKNVGKKNEISAEDQAVAEVEAKYRHKLKRDYHQSLDEIDIAMRFNPMLATKWEDRKSKIKVKTVYVQPKLDGIRCIIDSEGMWTREGLPILGAPHIFEAMKPRLIAAPSAIFDGELYNHKYRKDFNAIVSAVKNESPNAEELETSRKIVQYWIYDLPSVEKNFGYRSQCLHNAIQETEHLVLVETREIPIEDVEKQGEIHRGLEFEGTMVRLDEPYENKRSNFLMKHKVFKEEDFEIVDFEPGKGNRSGGAAKAVMKLPDGRTFKAGMIGNWEYCAEILLDKAKYIGKIGTVVFQDYTPDGIPRFGKFKCVRFDV